MATTTSGALVVVEEELGASVGEASAESTAGTAAGAVTTIGPPGVGVGCAGAGLVGGTLAWFTLTTFTKVMGVPL